MVERTQGLSLDLLANRLRGPVVGDSRSRGKQGCSHPFPPCRPPQGQQTATEHQRGFDSYAHGVAPSSGSEFFRTINFEFLRTRELRCKCWHFPCHRSCRAENSVELDARRTLCPVLAAGQVMSALPPKADKRGKASSCPLCANSVLTRRSKTYRRGCRARPDKAGTSRPMAIGRPSRSRRGQRHAAA